jgi:hypothetical protein
VVLLGKHYGSDGSKIFLYKTQGESLTRQCTGQLSAAGDQHDRMIGKRDMQSEVPELITDSISRMMHFVSGYYSRARSELSQQHIMAIGRRYSMMTDAYFEVAQLFFRGPDSDREQRYFNLYLNSLYINIFGSLENLTWMLYFEKIYEHQKLGKHQISLFRKELIRASLANGVDLSSQREKYYNWIRELKSKRDPIAHQIPMYVPFRVITNGEQRAEYFEMERLARQKLEDGDTHGWFEVMHEARKVGDFLPNIWLVDSVDESLRFVPFRQTVNGDMLIMNELVKEIFGCVFGDILTSGLS